MSTCTHTLTQSKMSVDLLYCFTNKIDPKYFNLF